MYGGISKLTDENRIKLKHAAAMDASVEEMGFYCNVSRQTVYNWLKADPELAEEIERLRETPVFKARGVVIGSLDDPEYAKWYLERKKKKEFSSRTEMTGENGGAVIIQVAKEGIEKYNLDEPPLSPSADTLGQAPV